MDPEHVKFELSKVVTELVRFLQIKEIETIVSEEDGNTYVLFHGYSYPDAYENDIMDLFEQLDQLIYLSHLNDLDQNKLILLVESISERLNFTLRYNSMGYEETANDLDKNQTEVLNEFNATQIRVHQTILDRLIEKYLSTKVVNKATLAKMTWKGKQNQLAELFYVLQKRNWIDIGPNKDAFYRTIAALFSCESSDKVFENMKTYFKKETMSYDAFKDIKENKI